MEVFYKAVAGENVWLVFRATQFITLRGSKMALDIQRIPVLSFNSLYLEKIINNFPLTFSY